MKKVSCLHLLPSPVRSRKHSVDRALEETHQVQGLRVRGVATASLFDHKPWTVRAKRNIKICRGLYSSSVAELAMEG